MFIRNFSKIQQNKNTQKGFTLIELLVVISIIALIGSIVLAGLQGARSKARDTKRVQEVKSIEKALSLYSLDNGGYVPKSSYTTMSGSGSDVVPKKSDGSIDCAQNKTNTETLFDILVPKYLSSRPEDDPKESLGYCYVYISSGDVIYTAGAEYDNTGTLISPVILATADSSTKNKNAVFFSMSENVKTNSGNNALVGVSVGINPPIQLNVDLTTGIYSNTSYGQSISQPLSCSANQHESSGACVCDTGYISSGSSCVLDTSCQSGYYWNGSACAQIPSCSSGQTWNGSACVSVCSSLEIWDATQGICITNPCPSGQTPDSNSVCVSVCPSGQIWDAADSICKQDTSCPSGQTWDSGLSTCVSVCSSGQIWDNGANGCITDTSCPNGGTWNEWSQSCQ